jgi:hypothetical protein
MKMFQQTLSILLICPKICWHRKSLQGIRFPSILFLGKFYTRVSYYWTAASFWCLETRTSKFVLYHECSFKIVSVLIMLAPILPSHGGMTKWHCLEKRRDVIYVHDDLFRGPSANLLTVFQEEQHNDWKISRVKKFMFYLN